MIASAILFGALTSSASAQERLEVLAVSPEGDSATMAEFDVGFSTFGTVRQVARLPAPSEQNSRGRAPGPLVPLAGGRYLVWLNFGLGSFETHTFSVFDRRTRAVTHTAIATYATVVLSDPIRPRLFIGGHPGFGAATGQIVLFDAATQITTDVGPVPAGATRSAWANPRPRFK